MAEPKDTTENVLKNVPKRQHKYPSSLTALRIDLIEEPAERMSAYSPVFESMFEDTELKVHKSVTIESATVTAKK